MKRTILLDPYPRKTNIIFKQSDLERLKRIAELRVWGKGKMPDEKVEEYLPEAFAVIGQTDLMKDRLERAHRLKAIINVEGNFLQNIDYEYCFSSGIYVLSTGNAFSCAVAEMALCFCLAMTRGIVKTDRLFREGKEIYGRESNASSFLLSRKKIGIIGFGNIAQSLAALLKPFKCDIMVYDPWLPDNFIREKDFIPSSLMNLLTHFPQVTVAISPPILR